MDYKNLLIMSHKNYYTNKDNILKALWPVPDNIEVITSRECNDDWVHYFLYDGKLVHIFLINE